MPRGHKGLHVNESFFKEWTRESAWVYGWLLTDGSVSENGQIKIMLKSTDRDVLEKIKHVLRFDGQIYDGEHRDGRKFSYLRICRKEMAEDLFEIGMARKDKTFNTKLPHVPDNVFWDLMRGIFEGDGNLKHGERWNDLTITIASATKQFVLDLQKALEERGIYTTIKTREPGKSGNIREMYTLVTKSNADALRWCFFMYANTDESIRMNRKFETYRKYIHGYYDRKRRSQECIELVELARQNIPECSDSFSPNESTLEQAV